MTVYTLRWGVIATGWISERFAKDLVIDPSTRNVTDVAHKLIGVASRSTEKAAKFISDFVPESGAKAYGSYESLLADPDIDAVYIGTPHNSHYPTALLALRAGKHVLCEKPFTINASQARHLASVAKEKNLFLMEGVWTRFFPLTLHFSKLLYEDKVIGKIFRATSDLSASFNREANPRLFKAELGGGALLDVGVYSLTWQNLIGYRHPGNANKAGPYLIRSAMQKTEDTGVDENTSVTLLWKNPGFHFMSVATAGMDVDSPREVAVRVQGELGQIIVPTSACRPEQIIVRLNDAKEDIVYDFPIPGHGLFYEADAVARDIRDGKIIDETYPIDETILLLDIFDEVRKQNDFVYPAEIEKSE